jgi:methylated-DNA-[protein]-cysteine S-methyltransferase
MATPLTRLRLPQLSIHAPFGALTFSEDDGAIVAVDWGWGRDQEETVLLVQACEQMHEYLDGERQDFDLLIRPAGSAYQQRVWATLASIPYGQTWTYSAVAHRAGGSPQSVAQAGRRNPLPIVVPCHRAVAARGLGGYSDGQGLDTKRYLLQLEARPA